MRLCQDGCRQAALGRREEEERQRLDRDNAYLPNDPRTILFDETELLAVLGEIEAVLETSVDCGVTNLRCFPADGKGLSIPVSG